MWLSECHNKSKVPVSKELITTPGEGLAIPIFVQTKHHLLEDVVNILNITPAAFTSQNNA